MRAAALAFVLAACGPAEPGAVLCEPEDAGDVGLRLDAPAPRDTVVLSVPFAVRVAVEAGGRVGDVGVRLVWRPDGKPPGLHDSTLYERTVSTGPGRYTARFLVQIDSLPGGAPADSLGRRGAFSFGAYGEQGMTCRGLDGELFSVRGASAPVTVLDRPAPP